MVFSEASVEAGRSVRHRWGRDNRWETIPDSVLWLPAGLRPRKQGVNWMRRMVEAAALMLLGAASMTVSLSPTATWWRSHRSRCGWPQRRNSRWPVRLHALSALQKNAFSLEYRSSTARAVGTFRAGLSQNDDLLAALFPALRREGAAAAARCGRASSGKAAHRFVQLPPDSSLREKMTRTAYGQLKQYLMLTRPEKMDAAWFATTLMQDWSQRSGIADAVWQGSGPSLLAFMPPVWRRIRSGVCLSMTVWSARCLRLIRQMGQRNGDPRFTRRCSRRWRISMPICLADD